MALPMARRRALAASVSSVSWGIFWAGFRRAAIGRLKFAGGFHTAFDNIRLKSFDHSRAPGINAAAATAYLRTLFQIVRRRQG